uniref:Uncharacterized protein n=1 Tax=Moumouvirus sp. 'Monve' TaxID=1128131 RepID=H2EE43_9VIRU|nr:hypothetical protein mv_L461 [Moumouvirus Monve]
MEDIDNDGGDGEREQYGYD